ncbi:MAG: phosphatase PAP2 family protein [Bdellovibrionaceae bacterium]|nr:phosphatase PAP2 family protein [Pseudobdellovibrionaceae bacterium]
MKKLIVLILSLSFVACQNIPPAVNAPTAVEASRKTVYLNDELYEEIKAKIPDFPKKGSAAQSIDEFALRKFQKSRTEKECERANTEVIITLQSFYGKPYGQLDDKQVQILIPLFDQIRADAGFYIGQIKRNYNRLRPYDYMKDLVPCTPLEKSLSYPSGHSTLAVLYALVLADVFPSKVDHLKARAEVIAQDRVLAGVHHPSDIVGGKKFGLVLYNEMVKSPRYKSDIEQYQKLLN